MDQRSKAIDQLQGCIIAGTVLGVIGGFIAALTIPGTEVSVISGDVEETGSQWGFIVGLLLAFGGNALLAVGLVGWGVKLGREASPEKVVAG
jgi:hypothetical protein